MDCSSFLKITVQGPAFGIFSSLSVQLWILANSFGMLKLESAVISACEQKLKQQKYEDLQSSTLSFVYEKMAPGSPLRQFFISMCVERVSSARSATSKNKFPAEFCRDLCEMLIVKAEATILHDPVNSTGNFEAPKPLVRLPGQLFCCFRQYWRRQPFWI